MGGGGVMRATAKAAALGRYRTLDQAAAAAARRSPPAALSLPAQAAEGLPPSLSSASASASVDVGFAVEQKASWNIDDWEFAGGKEEQLFDAAHLAPTRLVFGPVPTLDEAKEATSDLKDALEKLYFSPTATGHEGSAFSARSTSYESSSLESLDVKNKCVAVLPSAPRQVVQAFSLLQQSPEAQDVVASLASDKNIWDAVMKNEKVMEFYRTHQINPLPAETIAIQEESVNDDGKSMDSSVDKEIPEGSENGFTGFMHSMKAKAAEVVDKISDFFKDWMGATGAGGSTARLATAEGGYVDWATGGASFLVLAIAAILVILLKRG